MKRFFNDVVGLGLAVVIVLGWSYYREWQKDKVLPEEWFIIRQVSVADFSAGTNDAPVVYDREIRRAFEGDWIVKVITVPDNHFVCSGNGANYYEPQDKVPEIGVTFKWFVGKDCDLSPGQYALRVHYKLRVPGYPEKSLDVSSNVFRVLPFEVTP